MRCCLGVMSGTSLDGIDVVAASFPGDAPRLHLHRHFSWPGDLPGLLRRLTAADWHGDWTEVGRLHARLGEAYAAACAGVLADPALAGIEVAAIGLHGQTVHHAPDARPAFSLQLGDASRVAARCGLPVVSDFRSMDIALGGEGAPLVPAAHRAWFHSAEEDRAVLNLGGIANLTLLPATGPVRGFDTGPGNCLMDLWTRRHLGRDYDEDGAWAASAPPDAALLERLLDEPFFRRPPPRSTGTQHFSAGWLQARLTGDETPATVQATLLALTVEGVARALETWLPTCRRLLVCGGGAHNPALMTALARRLPDTLVESTEHHGLPPTTVEATAFAWLAERHLRGLPGNLPEATGAARSAVLGCLYPPPEPPRR